MTLILFQPWVPAHLNSEGYTCGWLLTTSTITSYIKLNINKWRQQSIDWLYTIHFTKNFSAFCLCKSFRHTLRMARSVRLCVNVLAYSGPKSVHCHSCSFSSGPTCGHSNRERQLQTGPRSPGNGAGQSVISRVSVEVNKLHASVLFNQRLAEPCCN